MTSKIKKFFADYMSDYSVSTAVDLSKAWVWPLVGGGVISVLTYVTDRLNKYAPLSYGAAFLLGALAIVWIRYILSASRLKRAKAIRLELAARPKSLINPLDSVFQNQRIYLEDFFNVYEPAIIGKTFINCELIGPAVLNFAQNVTINSMSLGECDFAKLRAVGKGLNVGIDLRDVVITNCRIYKVLFLVPAGMADQLNSKVQITRPGTAGANWITD